MEATEVDEPIDKPSGGGAQQPGTGSTSEFVNRPEPVPEDWTAAHADCVELGAQYESLLRQVELDKLEKRKLSDKQKQASMKTVEMTVKQGASSWLTACEEIVGKIQVRARWRCAAKATNIERFNGCMDGKFDQESGD
jgi:hypothetical protein